MYTIHVLAYIVTDKRCRAQRDWTIERTALFLARRTIVNGDNLRDYAVVFVAHCSLIIITEHAAATISG
jgi:hypothetical protein